MTLGNDHRNESKTLVQSILASRVQPRKVECTREVFYVLAPTNRIFLAMEHGVWRCEIFSESKLVQLCSLDSPQELICFYFEVPNRHNTSKQCRGLDDRRILSLT